MSRSPTLSTLRTLADIISSSVSAIENACISREMDIPSMDMPFSPQSEAPLMDLEISRLASTIVSAASQISVMIVPAPIGLFTTSAQFHICSALRVAVETNVVEILRESGPKGLPVEKISEINGVAPDKLGRILRILATEHIFKEVSPDTFANNRVSSTLDTGKDVKELLERPEEKFVGTSGVAAAISNFTDEQFKTSAYLTEALTDAEFAKHEDGAHTAFNKAFNTDLPAFAWLEQPGNENKLRRFGIIFEAGSRMFPADVILQGYTWEKLAPDSLIVDVGGGIGTQTMVLAKSFPQLKFIVQDREAVVPDGIKYFEGSAPHLLRTGQVTFQVHDFFTQQPAKNARVYLMRMILHDWPESAGLEILRHLREAANPETELIIIETLLEYPCPDTTVDENVPGMRKENPAPAPLLPNYGHANIFPYLGDIQMMGALNGGERTAAQYSALLRKTGWKMTQIHRVNVGFHKIVASVL